MAVVLTQGEVIPETIEIADSDTGRRVARSLRNARVCISMAGNPPRDQHHAAPSRQSTSARSTNQDRKFTAFGLWPRYVWAQNRAGLQLRFAARQSSCAVRTGVNNLLESILGDPNLGLTATDRMILLCLQQFPEGCRVEDIAKLTGSKYRWIESEVLRLTRIGVLRRVAPNTYAIESDRGVSK